MQTLPLFFRLTGKSVILLGTGEAAVAKARLLERAGAEIVDETAEAVLAIVAIEDDAEAQAAVERLKARGILVNAVDRPDLCDFMVPAIVDRDPVIVAIGTGGASAGLAKALRQRFEQLLPARLGALARRLKDKKEAMRERWPDGAVRRLAIDEALSEGGRLDPLAPHPPVDVDEWVVEGGSGPSRHDQFEIVQLRSADPHDLTIGEMLLLGRADRIFLAPGVPESIANRARADAERIRASGLPDNPGPGLSVYITVSPVG
jgi:uroporphyrin-III C-methyltransferase/precorrin-2 dehydrogenase/sirohydrochlorin ferrochelatase